MMKIAIFGTGKMGFAVGRALANSGHAVVFGSRYPDASQGRLAGISNASVKFNDEAAREGDVGIIAVPWFAASDLAESLAPMLAGKVVIDLTNPASSDFSRLVVGGSDSAAEVLARALPHAKVVKAFNTITADNFANPMFSGDRAQVLYCGDDTDAKVLVGGLVEACGYTPRACGPLSNARYLEAMAMLWLQLAFWEEWGTSFSFRIAGDTPDGMLR